MIGIVNYGMGNIFSVLNAFEHLGEDVVICSESKELEKVSRIVLPGVGAFPDCLAALRERELIDILNYRVLNEKVPFLGICLGMQVLAKSGEESGGSEGLGWLDSTVKKIEPSFRAFNLNSYNWD